MIKLKSKITSKDKIIITYVFLIALFFMQYIFIEKIFYFLDCIPKNFRIYLIFILFIANLILSRVVFKKIRNKYCDKSKDGIFIVIADYILVMQLALIFGLFFGILELKNLRLDYEFITNLFLFFCVIYLFRSIVINIILTNSFGILVYLVIIYFLGIIDLSKWTLLSIILNIITFTLNYDEYNIFNKYIGLEIDEKKEVETKEKLTFMKFELLISSFIMYIFLLITDNLNVTGYLYKKINNEILLPNLINKLFMGLDKFIILFIIYMVYFVKFKKNKEKYKNKIIKKFVKIIDNFKP